MPITVLILVGIAVAVPAGQAGPLNAGPHGFSEILYAFTSQGNNNGSAFGGLTGNTAFYNILGAIAMLIGRFAIMIPALALGGVLAAKNVVPASLGTFRTDNGMFIGLTIGVILIIGGLTFFPAVSLGPDRRAALSRKVLLMTTPEMDGAPAGTAVAGRAAGPDGGARGGRGPGPLRPGDPGSGPHRRLQEAGPAGADQEPGHVRGAGRHRDHLHRGHRHTPPCSPGRSPPGCS